MSDKVDHLTCRWCGATCGIMGDNGWIKVNADPDFECLLCVKAYERGRADERAAIVAWLRAPNEQGAFYGSFGAKSLADAIEREFKKP